MGRERRSQVGAPAGHQRVTRQAKSRRTFSQGREKTCSQQGHCALESRACRCCRAPGRRCPSPAAAAFPLLSPDPLGAGTVMRPLTNPTVWGHAKKRVSLGRGTRTSGSEGSMDGGKLGVWRRAQEGGELPRQEGRAPAPLSLLRVWVSSPELSLTSR